jgi:tRNA A-37 threonylcarbamoyl transferase component Bud32
MEKIEGKLLCEWITGVQSPAHREDVATSLSDSVTQLHSSGHVHGDLRGTNIVVTGI